MIIDFHTHIFPKEIRQNKNKFFLSEPAFKLLYESPKSKMIGVTEILKAMDENQVDMSVIFGFPWLNRKTFKINNDYIINAVKKYPDRFKGFACFDIFNQESKKETIRCFEAGLCGVGELALYQSGINKDALKALEPVMDICSKFDSPVLMHTNEPVGHNYPGKTTNTLLQIYNFVKKFKKNKIVLAHWGGGIFFYNLLKKEVKETFKNVYFDTAASPFLYDNSVYNTAIELTGENNILFGSDYPLINPERYFSEINKTKISKKIINKILGENAKTLLKIKNPV